MSTLVTTNLKNEASASNNIVLNADGSVDLDGGLLYVDAANNQVGIGTTSPNNLLHLLAAGSSYLQIQNTTASNNFYVGNSSGSGIFELSGSNQFKFISNSSDRVVIDSSGRLLVGTSSAYDEYVGASSSYIGTLQIARNIFDGVAQFSNWTSDTGLDGFGGTQLFISRCKSGTVGSHTGGALSSGNPIGRLIFNTSDGTNFRSSAYITAEVDGAVSTADVPGRLVFSTTANGASSPTERMRISENGQFRYFSSDDALAARTSVSAGTAKGVFKGYHSASSVTDGTNSVVIWSNGDIQNTNNSYGQLTSDERFKQDIVDAPSQWDDIKAVRLTKYRWKSDPTGDLLLGPIAQELQAVSPGLVNTRIATAEDVPASGGLVAEGDEVLSFKASILYMKAVKALQEAMERIEQLESEMAAVKAQLS